MKLLFILLLLTHKVDKPVGWILIPSIYLYQPLHVIPIIDQNWDTSNLGNGAGWLEGTNDLDDGWGSVGLAGHNFGAFKDFTHLQIGDMIIVGMNDVVEVYQIDSIHHNRPPSEWQWLAPSVKESLVLITCEGQNRMIVIAYRITERIEK